MDYILLVILILLWLLAELLDSYRRGDDPARSITHERPDLPGEPPTSRRRGGRHG